MTCQDCGAPTPRRQCKSCELDERYADPRPVEGIGSEEEDETEADCEVLDS